MNDQTYLQIQAAELQRLLDTSRDDPILGPQLQDRLAEVRGMLQAARQQPGTLLPKEMPSLPRAAIFLRGRDVQESTGIRPSLAGEILIQYEKMYTEQALHDERVAARTEGRQRRPRGALTPELLFTGTPRGSFGLEFVPQFRDDDSLGEVHSNALVHVGEALARVAGGNVSDLKAVVTEIPPRVLGPLKQFLRILAQYEAELRLAFEDRPSQSLSASQIQNAADLLERDIEEQKIRIQGIFRGVTLDSGNFDLRINDETFITGIVADQLTEEDLERINRLTNGRCEADLQKTIFRSIGGGETVRYVLLDAQETGAT
jgi:hypothetical protein